MARLPASGFALQVAIAWSAWHLVAAPARVAQAGATPAGTVAAGALDAGRPEVQGAPAGTIRGRVDLARPDRAPGPRPDEAAPGMSDHPPVEERRQAVVFLETAPQPAFDDRPLTRARMDQRNETFVPHLLAVPVGSVVEFPNDDRVFHNVFSLSKARTFDLGRYPQGQSRAVRFDTPGVVRVFCEIHSHMSAYILVFSHRYFSVTDAEGRFSIDRVPPGTYTLAAWYEGATIATRQVTIAADGTAPDVLFSIR